MDISGEEIEDFRIESQRVTLVPLSPIHTQSYWSYHKLNFKQFRETVPYDTPDPPDYEDIEKAVDSELKMSTIGRALRFLAFEKNYQLGDLPIGDILIYNIIWAYSNSAHISYTVDSKWQGKGIATEMLREAVAYAFSVMGLHRLELNIMLNNKASVKVAENVGFQYEGVSRELQLLNGKWHDMKRYSLLSTEWNKG